MNILPSDIPSLPPSLSLLSTSLHQLFEGRYGKDFYSELCQVETSLLSYCEDYELPTESVNGGQVSSLISQMLTNPAKKKRVREKERERGRRKGGKERVVKTQIFKSYY